MLALLSVPAFAEVKVSVKVSPNPVAVNQSTNLVISIENGELQVLPEPKLPDPVGVAGAPSQSQEVTFVNGVQSSMTMITWPISCAKEGVYTIPSFNVQVSGKAYATKELKVEFVAGGMTTKPDGPNRENGRTATDVVLQIQPAKTEFYQGEIVPVTATLYVPITVNLARVGLVELEKSDFAVQRFPQGASQGLETLGRVRYRSYAFNSTLSALKAGKSTLGPGKMELIIEMPVAGGGGGFPFPFQQMQRQKVTVESVEIPVNVLPLPPEGRPASFSGAVGDFRLKASTGSREAMVGDPVSVDLIVEGQGNFDALDAPKLTQPDGWKIYPPRRYNVDNTDPNTADLMNRGVGFSQILVPEKVLPAVPPFEFSFFNPRTKTYSTLRSNPLELVMKASDKAAPPMMTEPVTAIAGQQGKPEVNNAPALDITDILVRVPALPRWATASVPLMQDGRFKVANVLLGLCFLALVATHLYKQARARKADSVDDDRRQLLNDLERGGLSEAEFYRGAAQYLHRYGGGQVPEAAHRLLQKYEQLNFAGPSAGSGPVDPADRAEALAVLKQLKPIQGGSAVGRATVVAAMLIVSVASAHAGDATGTPESRYQAAAQALAKEDFNSAKKLGEAMVKEGDIGPDVFTLLGHASYKLKNLGGASIWYQRALFFPSAIPETRQNLRHLADKTHFFSFHRNELLEAFAAFASRNQWATLASVGGWLAVFSLTFLFLGAGPSLRVWIVLAMFAGITGAVLGVVALNGRPTSATLQDLAFVTQQDALAHTAAAEISGHVISVPAGSTVRCLEKRGAWTYVEIPQEDENVFGWLPSAGLEPVWPYDPNKLP